MTDPVVSYGPEDVPFQLVPVIRIGDAPLGFDTLGRLRDCYRGVLPTFRDLSQLVTADDATKPLLDVPTQEELAASTTPAIAASLKQAADTLHSFVDPYLPPPLGALADSSVACLVEPQESWRAGTVVLVRRTDVLTEQYVFPRVYVDLDTGRKHAENLPAAPPPKSPATNSRGIRAMATPGSGMAKPVFTWLASVTPFIPPPYGAIASGFFSLVNILLDLTDQKDPQPSPYQQVVKQITDFIASDDLKKQGKAPLTDVTTQMDGMMKSLDKPFDQLDSIKDDVETLWTYIDGIRRDAYFLGDGVQMVDAANAFLWETLQTCDDQDYDATLALLVRGVTLQLTLYKMSVQLRTLAARELYLTKSMTSFDSETSTWHAQVRRIGFDVGVPATGGSSAVKGADPTTGLPSGAALASFTQDDIDAGLGSTSWIPRIFAWAAKIRRDRLALIDDAASRYDVTTQGLGGLDGSSMGRRELGWSWCDQRIGGDNGWAAHVVDDTQASGCCASNVQHQDTVNQNRAAYVTSTATALDNALSTHLQSVLSWVTFVRNFEALLPTDSSTSPLTASTLAGGPATPLPPGWLPGNMVRYQVAAVGAQGPATAGPWSNELAVTGTAGATISGLTAPLGSKALWLYRQARASNQKWDAALEADLLTIVQPDATGAFPTSYDDQDSGS